MGRLKRITELSEEEKQKLIERRRVSSKKYYWKNKERIDKVCRERYQNKIKSQNELREDL
jgi:alpha-D-ribose 1-methylphosphonate 5-triphosphate diphosphatase PhnM